MKAINYYLIVEKIKTKQKKIAGLLMTEATDVENQFVKGNVISIGSLVEGIKEDDVVYYGTHAGHSITIGEKLYQVIKSPDVVLVE